MVLGLTTGTVLPVVNWTQSPSLGGNRPEEFSRTWKGSGTRELRVPQAFWQRRGMLMLDLVTCLRENLRHFLIQFWAKRRHSQVLRNMVLFNLKSSTWVDLGDYLKGKLADAHAVSLRHCFESNVLVSNKSHLFMFIHLVLLVWRKWLPSPLLKPSIFFVQNVIILQLSYFPVPVLIFKD